MHSVVRFVHEWQAQIVAATKVAKPFGCFQKITHCLTVFTLIVFNWHSIATQMATMQICWIEQLSRYGKIPGVSLSVFTNLKDIIPLQATNINANVTDALDLKTDRGNVIEGSIEANPLRCICNIGTTCCALGHCLNKDVNSHEGVTPSNLDAFHR